MALPLNVGFLIEPDDDVVSFLKVLEGVDLRQYIKENESQGRKGYNKVDMLRTILFAYMNGHYHTRDFEKLCRTDVRFMFLMREECPSHNAFARFMRDHLITDIDRIYFDITRNIISMMNISPTVQYIDGTKFEAYANKYTFVYKRRIINNRGKLFLKITDSINELNRQYGHHYPAGGSYCAQEIGYIVQYLMEGLVQSQTDVVYGKGCRKTELQRSYDAFASYYAKLLEYEYWLDVIGERRNSCSKTDHDATMGALKIDYYCNTGLSRPCYNAQIAVSDGIIVNAGLYQSMGDTSTFVPFMDRFSEHYGHYPVFPVADAGYGSYSNYWYALEHGMQLVMKYSYYAKKNESGFRKDIFNTMNWKTDNNGHRICPEGHVFDRHVRDSHEDRNGYLSITQMYESGESCKGCPSRGECFKSEKRDRRLIGRNVILDEFHGEVDEKLSTEFGGKIKKQRSVQAEGAFGVIKEDMKFTRFSRKGLGNTKMEFLLVCLAYNFRKYHHYRLREEKKKKRNTEHQTDTAVN